MPISEIGGFWGGFFGFICKTDLNIGKKREFCGAVGGKKGFPSEGKAKNTLWAG